MTKHRCKYFLGLLVQFVIGTLVFGTIYAVVYYIISLQPSWLTGGAMGLIHGFLVGLSLPIVSKLDPGMRKGKTPYPGVLAVRYGLLGIFGLLFSHVVYGIIYGVLYSGNQASFHLWSAWLSGFMGTIGATIIVEAGRLFGLGEASTVAILANSIDIVLYGPEAD